MTQSDNERRNNLSTLLIVLVGQVGCLTLIVILLSVIAGLWLDNSFHTKPVFTLVLLFAGVPISVLVMLYVARKSIAKLNNQGTAKQQENH